MLWTCPLETGPSLLLHGLLCSQLAARQRGYLWEKVFSTFLS